MRPILATLLLLLFSSLASAQCQVQPYCGIIAPPATQTIGAGDTIAANACGSVKRVSAAGGVTTSTTDTFTRPTGGSDGCWMSVCNTSANAITLDANANFVSAGAADVVLGANDCVSVVQTGTVWRQVSALLDN